MASTTYLPSRTNLNHHITFSETFHPRSHSFGQVSLPKRYNDSLSLSTLSLLGSSSSPGIITTNATVADEDLLSYYNISYSISSNTILSHQLKISYNVKKQMMLQNSIEERQNTKHQNKTLDLHPTGVGVSNNNPTTTPLYNFWREVQGCNNWENLLNPLHPLLRQEIIRYGEFVTASYKAFDLDPNSKRYLNCKYGKKRMLKEVGMSNSGYEVTKYIYATPDINIPNIQNSSSSSNSGRWIGYVAVSSDEATKKLGRRDIVITFRGTVTYQEWIANFMSSLTPPMLDPHNPQPNVKVESGFLSLYTSDESSSEKFGLESCREQLLSEVSRLLNKYKGEKLSISLAGHSMGSALALLLAYDIAELGLNKNIRASIPAVCMEKTVSGDAKFTSVISTSRKGLVSGNRPKTRGAHQKNNEIPITVFSFGGPRVGNLDFKSRCEELGVKVLRIANVNDPITKLPGVLFNENFRVFGGGRYEFPWSCSCYAHVGVELMLDFFNVQNPSCVHDLESYIGLLRSPSVETMQPQRDQGINNFVEKVRELVMSSQHNIKILPGVFAGSDHCHGLLNSFSRDILCSCGDELLFGLVLLLS